MAWFQVRIGENVKHDGAIYGPGDRLSLPSKQGRAMSHALKEIKEKTLTKKQKEDIKKKEKAAAKKKAEEEKKEAEKSAADALKSDQEESGEETEEDSGGEPTPEVGNGEAKK